MYSRIALVCACYGLLSSTVFAQGGGGAAQADANALSALEMQVAVLKDQVKDLNNQLKALSDVQQSGQQAIQQIASKDIYGRYYPRFDASHEPTRVALRDAINAATPTTGTVVLYNKTNSNQSVVVNDTTYEVLANSKRPVSVPYGNFEVRTSNNKLLRWSFNYPQTRSVIDIVDTSEPTYASN